MPRKAAVGVEELLAALKNEDTIFDGDKLLPKSHEVWKRISTALNNKMASYYVWQYLHENRKDSYAAMREHHGLPPLPEKICPPENEDEDSEGDEGENHKHVSNDHVVLRKKRFVILVGHAEWEKMKPGLRIQQRKDRDCKARQVLVFQDGWGNILHDILYEQQTLTCAYTLKSRINMDPTLGSYYASITGKCGECGGEGEGFILVEPHLAEGDSFSFEWKATDTRTVHHSKKRRLAGQPRQEFGRKCENMSATLFRRQCANNSMSLSDPESPTLQRAATLRTAKYKGNKYEIDKYTDEITTVRMMKTSPQYVGKIHEVAADKVKVTYDTPGQLLVYKSYKNKGYTRTVSDSSGSLAKKIPKLTAPGDAKLLSGHLFLFELVLSIEGVQMPVCQMVTEKQDTAVIVYWLHDWLRRGGRPSDEVVVDPSPALIAAFCMAFGKAPSTKEYLEIQFACLTGERVSPAPCYVRKDVAHMTKNAATWKVWREEETKLVKEFYIRCFALLVQCTSLKKFEELALHILTITAAETIGEVEDTGDLVPAEESLVFLSNEISKVHTFDVETIMTTLQPWSDSRLQDFDEAIDAPQSIQLWIAGLNHQVVERCEVVGTRVSPYRSEKVGEKFMTLYKDFVLWSAVMVPVYSSPFLRGSSAGSEGSFNDLKNIVLQNETQPIPLSQLLARHIESIEGMVKIYAANFHGEDHDEDVQPVDAAVEDLSHRDNWKNKGGEPKQKKPKTKYFTASVETRLAQENCRLKPPKSRLLINGDLHGALTIDKSRVLLKSTCNIDSIVHVLAASYIDHTEARKYIQHSQKDFCQLVKSLATVGAVKETYALRASVCMNVYNHEDVEDQQRSTRANRATSSTFVDCKGNFLPFAQKVLDASVHFVPQCTNTRCRGNQDAILKVIKPDFTALQRGGFKDLQRACDVVLNIENSPCNRPRCNGEVRSTVNLQPILNIDISQVMRLPPNNPGPLDSTTNLEDIPRELVFQWQQGKPAYLLTGVVAYQPNHCIAFVRNLGGKWERFDDIRSSVLNAAANTSVQPMPLTYSLL